MNVPARTRGQTLQRAAHSRFSRQVVLPVQRFLHTEALGGAALVLAVACALVWANWPFSDSYARFWHADVSLDVSVITLTGSLQHWVNDGLMVLFFFVVGLEIKRELVMGELSGRARAALPAAAALGGMLAPALIYLSLNPTGSARDGWGVVIATDIAFAVGVLALLSRYVPHQARVFLLAIAIFDDIGAVAVIAIFFTDDLSLRAIVVAASVLALIIAARQAGIANLAVYFIAGAVLWAAVYESGIHPTLAGVVLAALAPVRPLMDQRRFLESGSDLMARYRQAVHDGDAEEAGVIVGQLEQAAQDTEAPLERLERLLHPLSSFLVVPIFVLANAGIDIKGSTFGDAFTTSMGAGVLLGLVLGKPLGIAIATLLATRLGLGALPNGVRMRDVIGVGMLAGIGFTVSIFVTNLAYDSAGRIELAKAAIFLAFIISSVAGFLFLRLTARPPAEAGPAPG
jgi:NhaA family Na+:H+ antiporter